MKLQAKVKIKIVPTLKHVFESKFIIIFSQCTES